MPAIVDFPELVKKGIEDFGHVFSNEPERIHFGEYLTGLLICARKTVSRINSDFAETTDQSCLNRWLTKVSWDEQELNRLRLQAHQVNPETRYSSQGVIAIDNVLIDHDGKMIEDVGWFWDHAELRNKLAHDYLISNYVCTSGKHYAIDFRRFRKEEDCLSRADYLVEQYGSLDKAPQEIQVGAVFRNHNQLFIELVDDIIRQNIPGTFTFDSYFTNAGNLNYLNDRERTYVGDLKFNRKIEFKGERMRAEELAKSIGPEDRKELVIDGKKQWYFTVSMRIPKLDHGTRILILWARKNSQEPRKILITNQRRWEASRICRVYRRRWTGTETFHRDGKQHLGMGDCQLRSSKGHTRHMYLVMLAHSLLIDRLQQGRAREWYTNIATTIGEACRVVLRETLATTIDWAIDRSREGWNHEIINTTLGLC